MTPLKIGANVLGMRKLLWKLVFSKRGECGAVLKAVSAKGVHPTCKEVAGHVGWHQDGGTGWTEPIGGFYEKIVVK